MPDTFGEIPFNEYRQYYATMFKTDDTAVLTVDTAGVYKDIEGFSAGTLLGWTFQDGKELVCHKEGVYLILWQTVLQSLQNNVEVHISLKNATTAFLTTRDIKTVEKKNDFFSLRGFGVGPSLVGNVGRLGITSFPASDFIIKDAKLTLVRLDS